jgi:hypothetical protein
MTCFACHESTFGRVDNEGVTGLLFDDKIARDDGDGVWMRRSVASKWGGRYLFWSSRISRGKLVKICHKGSRKDAEFQVLRREGKNLSRSNFDFTRGSHNIVGARLRSVSEFK